MEVDRLNSKREQLGKQEAPVSVFCWGITARLSIVRYTFMYRLTGNFSTHTLSFLLPSFLLFFSWGGMPGTEYISPFFYYYSEISEDYKEKSLFSSQYGRLESLNCTALALAKVSLPASSYGGWHQNGKAHVEARDHITRSHRTIKGSGSGFITTHAHENSH